MASSQVQIATSSPFANHRDPCFQNNLNNLVSSCIPNDNSRHLDLDDLWVHHPQWQTTTTTTTSTSTTTTTTSAATPPIPTPTNHANDNHSIHSEPPAPRRKGKWTRARDMILSVDHPHRSTIKARDSTSPDRFVEVPNPGGVSSLVQKWRGFEAEAKCCNSRNNPAYMYGLQDNDQDDPFGGWESDRTAFSGPPSSRSRDSDAAESERLRVADIIKKLTEERSNDVGSDSPPRIRTSFEQSEQRCFTPLLSSPRIRGRQAYNEMLMQMERDRRKELEGLVGRKAVSKFSHRGRIQAMLRIRFLRRSIEAKGAWHSNCTSSESHKAVQPAVVHFRLRVGASAPNGSAQSGSCRKDTTCAEPNLYSANQQEKENECQQVTNSKSCHRVRADDNQESQHSVTSKEQDANHCSHQVDENIQQNVHISHSYENIPYDHSPFSKHMRQEINWESSNHSLGESAETAGTSHNTETNSGDITKSIHNIDINIYNEEKEDTNQQIVKTNNELTTSDYDHHKVESPSNQHLVESDTFWVSDVSHPEVGWEELHSDYQQQAGNNRDWIEEVSRPRSDWEGLRQERYREMLDPFLDNEEIRLLLGRRSVSTFLSSGLREKIDQVIISRTQGQETLKKNQRREEKQLPKQVEAEISEEGEGEDYGNYFNEYEEAESSVEQRYNESDDYTDDTRTSPPASWPQQNQGHESSNHSYQVASPSAQQSSCNRYTQDNGHNSSYTTHPAIIKLQRSIKREVVVALNHTDRKHGRRNSEKKAGSGGRCCICCKEQVDCLLYRCGHMCTCYECAHQLQSSSGKCPICTAPILDVVRTYPNYS
ncbi:protein neuralized [Sesamum alatum]|uniref:Protein neuralized n=1 Tax=Sesamum alatum TaxID=300844 RepID=A0AAE1Z162_9LAMI|nr:protein neuralized [Sesamum alatum]